MTYLFLNSVEGLLLNLLSFDEKNKNLLRATGDGGRAPGMAPEAPFEATRSSPPLRGAEFLGVVELDPAGAEVGTLTGLVGVGGGGGATGTAGLMKGWLKNVSKSIRSRASLLRRPYRRLANSGEVPFGILEKKGVLLQILLHTLALVTCGLLPQ